MQPRLDAVSSAVAGADGTTLSWNHTLVGGKNKAIFVFTGSEWFTGPSNPFTSMTFGGIPMTLFDQHASTGGSHHAWQQVWVLWGDANVPAPGTYAIVASHPAPNSKSRRGIAVSFSNLRPITLEALQSATGSGAHPLTLGLTTLTSRALVVAGFYSQNAGGVSWALPLTEAAETGASGGEESTLSVGYGVIDVPGPITVSADLSNPESEVLIAIAWPFFKSTGNQIL